MSQVVGSGVLLLLPEGDLQFRRWKPVGFLALLRHLTFASFANQSSGLSTETREAIAVLGANASTPQLFATADNKWDH